MAYGVYSDRGYREHILARNKNTNKTEVFTQEEQTFTGRKTFLSGVTTSDLEVQTVEVSESLKIKGKEITGIIDVDNMIAYVDELVEGTKRELSAHKEDTNNPHQVTKGQIGLGNVPNLAPVAQGSKTSTAPIQAKAATGIAYGAICNTEATVQNKEVNINGFVLEAGAVVRVLFANANSAANPTLNVSYDGSTFTGAKAIKAVKAGQKIAPPVHSGKWRGATGYTDEMWQPYTTLELMYDGTDWVIMGNPELENWSNDTEGYTVLANGYIKQFGRAKLGSAYVELFIKFLLSTTYGLTLLPDEQSAMSPNVYKSQMTKTGFTISGYTGYGGWAPYWTVCGY